MNRVVKVQVQRIDRPADAGFHMNPQEIDRKRLCAFCFQMSLTQEHARGCPGKSENVRGW